jgi:protein-S-isoprenylcysteine O-methyltransferase Ste14
MGPLSAVATSIWLIIYGLVYANVFSASPTPSAVKAVAIIGIVVAIVILLDAFWINSYARWGARRQPPA